MLCGTPVASPEAALLKTLRRLGLRVGWTRALLLRSRLLERPGLRHLRLRILRLGHLRSCALLLRNLLLERPRLRHLLLSILRPAKLLLRGRLERPRLRELLLLLHLRS